jgi:hypothetical protein
MSGDVGRLTLDRPSMHQDGCVANETSTAGSTRSGPPGGRRRTAAVLAVVLLLIGIGLLLYSAASGRDRAGQVSTAPSPTTTPSPMTQTRTLPATPTPGGTSGGPPPVVVITTYVPVPTYVNMPATGPAESGALALVTTVTGLLASLAGILSAIVSMRGSRRQP